MRTEDEIRDLLRHNKELLVLAEEQEVTELILWMKGQINTLEWMLTTFRGD